MLGHFLLAQTYYSRGLVKEAIASYKQVGDICTRMCAINVYVYVHACVR